MSVTTMMAAAADETSAAGREDASVTPVKEMAVAERAEIASAQGGTGVEQAIGDVDGPCSEGEQNGNPRGQAHSSGVGEGKRPDYGDGGRIETYQVPETCDAAEAR